MDSECVLGVDRRRIGAQETETKAGFDKHVRIYR